MDYQDKMVKMFKKLLSNNIKLKTSDEDIHAKLIITDNYLLISSVNLNKMNLGFNITSKYWRENTETLCVISEKNIIKDALKKYNLFYEKSLDIKIRIAEKIEKRIGNIYKIYFNTKSKKEVKELFSKFIIQKEIEVEQSIIKIAKISAILSKNKNKQFVDTIDFLSALVLFFLTERKHDFNSLKDKLSIIDCEDKLKLVTNYLIKDNYIETEDDYYKIKLLSLFK